MGKASLACHRECAGIRSIVIRNGNGEAAGCTAPQPGSASPSPSWTERYPLRLTLFGRGSQYLAYIIHASRRAGKRASAAVRPGAWRPKWLAYSRLLVSDFHNLFDSL